MCPFRSFQSQLEAKMAITNQLHTLTFTSLENFDETVESCNYITHPYSVLEERGCADPILPSFVSSNLCRFCVGICIKLWQLHLNCWSNLTKTMSLADNDREREGAAADAHGDGSWVNVPAAIRWGKYKTLWSSGRWSTIRVLLSIWRVGTYIQLPVIPIPYLTGRDQPSEFPGFSR